MSETDSEAKLKVLDKLASDLLEDAVENSRRALPKGDNYEQGRKDALRLILVLLRDDPSIIEDAAF